MSGLLHEDWGSVRTQLISRPAKQRMEANFNG